VPAIKHNLASRAAGLVKVPDGRADNGLAKTRRETEKKLIAMKPTLDQVLAASLAAPVKQASGAANTAQFALLLSLAYHTQMQGVSVDRSDAQQPVASAAPWQLEHSLGVALQSGSAATAHLHRCLWQECMLPVDEPDNADGHTAGPATAGFERRGRASEMIREVEDSKKQAQGLAA